MHSINRLCENSKKTKDAEKRQEDTTRNAESDCDHEEDSRSIQKAQDNGERCHFGHKTTTTRVRGKVVWNRNPACSWWPGIIPGLVPLCNKCFQLGRRHFLKGKKAPLPHRDIDDDERPKKCSRISIAATANGAANGFATENNEHSFEEDSEDETAMPAHAQDVDIHATNVCVHM
jgi:hypothetical protein